MTPSSSGAGRSCPAAAASTAARAAVSIARPPEACTFIIHTPRRVAAAHACATVFGISWNLRSRNTRKPRATTHAHELGAGDDEELLADLEPAGGRIEPVGERERAHGIFEVEGDDYLGIVHHAKLSGVSVRRGEYVSHLPQPGQRQ